MSWIKNNEWLKPDTDHRIRWSELARFVQHYRPFRSELLLAAGLALAGSATAFLIPPILYRFQGAVLSRDMGLLLLVAGAYLGIGWLEAVTTYWIRVIRSRISTRLNRLLVLHYYGKLLNVAVEDFIEFRQRTNLFQRVVDAMAITPQFTDALVRGGQSLIVILVVGGAVGVIAPQVLGVLAAGAALVFLYTLIRSQELRELRQRTISFNYPLVGKMMEIISGLFTIKALSASPHVTRDVTGLVSRKTEAQFDEFRAEAEVMQFTRALRLTVLVFAMAFGTVLMTNGHIGLPDLLALYLLSQMLLAPVEELASLYQSLSRLSVNVAAFYQVVDLPDEAQQARIAATARAAIGGGAPAATQAPVLAQATSGGGATVAAFAMITRNGTPGGGSPRPARGAELHPGDEGSPPGHIVFEGVEFAYRSGAPVLTGIDLEIRPGEKVSLIGKSGAGKTTLLRLLLGYFQPQRGTILLDGRDISAHPDKNAYRRQFGVVSQHDVLFGISIRENLMFGVEDAVSEEVIEEALRLVDLWRDVTRFSDGLDSTYSEDLFSGGQRQRFFIARALLRRPSVVLLDEPTSALDFESEGLVMKAIERLVGGKTTVTIAHRLSTVRNADRVVVLDGGRVQGTGTHDELYGTNDYYRALCDYNSFVV